MKKTPPNKPRNLNYQFWISAGIYWLYKKRIDLNLSSWEATIKRYKGAGDSTATYWNEIKNRRDNAKKAYEKGMSYDPIDKKNLNY